MRTGIRGLVAAGAVSMLAIDPAAAASATSPGRPPGSPSTATQEPPNEVKGFIWLRGFPGGTLVKGGMGTFSEVCSRGNNGRPFEFRGEETLLDVTVTHEYFYYDPRCRTIGPQSDWQLVIGSPDGVKGTVTFFLGWDARAGNHLYCRSSSGALRCLDDRVSGRDLRMIVEPRR
jgi:hypothetical protein